MRSFTSRAFIEAAALALVAATSTPALACGGFFCNQNQPVNQAAEGIIFADNGDGTTTAVIQIQYQGPSENFSWLLPIASPPRKAADIGIASNIAFQRLQLATNPSFTLTTRVEGTCRQDRSPNDSASGSGGGASSGGPAPTVGGNGVSVAASGVVGSFEWTVLEVSESVADPAAATVEWLTANGYDVPEGAPPLLRPYLADGMYLLALKLTKGADTGSIRPIVLTYEGTEASIPLKLTAVAANQDMGVLTFLLGESRAVPKNYLSLEVNEARLNWFNPATNYNQVVIEASNDAGGQGFVTEFSGATTTLDKQVWTDFDDRNWTKVQQTVFTSFSDIFNNVYELFGAYDGFWDATRAAVTLPDNVKFEDLKACPNCYAAQVQFSPSTYFDELNRQVIAPIRLVQDLIDAHPKLSRLYTTLSPDEMTLDPLFTYNADLPDISNVHTAERVIECNARIYQDEAPWRIELPQGGTVRGSAADASIQNWPSALAALPPNARIVRTSSSGAGKVVEDNGTVIQARLDDYNADAGKTPAGTSESGCALAPAPAGVLPVIPVGVALIGWLLRRTRNTPRGRKRVKAGRS